MTRGRQIAALLGTVACVVGLIAVIWRNTSVDSRPAIDSPQVGDVYRRALSAAERQDYEVAERLLRDNLKKSPDHQDSRVLLGQVLWSRGNEEALALWERVPPTDPQTYGLASYLRGAAALDVGDESNAEEWLQRAVTVRPNLLSAIDSLRDLYLLQRRAPALRRLLAMRSSAVEPAPEELALDLLAGKAVYMEQQARESLKRFVDSGTGSPAAELGLVAVMIDAGELVSALQQLDAWTAATTGKKSKQASGTATEQHGWAMRLRVALGLQRQEVAAECVEYFVSQQSLQADAAVGLGEWCLQHDKPAIALTLLESAARANPFRSEIWNLAGQAAGRSGLESVARENFHRAVVADELERDAYLVLRGTPDARLLGRTMNQIADNLLVLEQPERAAIWNATAQRILRKSAEISVDVLASYQRVLNAESHDLTTTASDAGSAPLSVSIFEEIENTLRVDATATSEPADTAADESLAATFSFEDVAPSSGLHYRYDPGHSAERRIVETIGGGVCVLDYDLDGLPDLFFPQGGGSALQAALRSESISGTDSQEESDRLYRNLGGGQFADVSTFAGITGQRYSLGAAAFDRDNDGDADIVVGAIGETVIYENRGDGTFSQSVLRAESDLVTAGIGVGDFDGDSACDLWLVNYVGNWRQTCTNAAGDFSTCLPASYPPQSDVLLLSDGAGQYVVQKPVLASPAAGRGLGVATIDLNGDGQTDVYIANDGSPNHLFLSDSSWAPAGRESAMLRGCALSSDGRSEAGMGIAVADFDGDRNCDFFVTNFTHESNRLYSQDKNGYFRDVSAQWGIPAVSLSLLGFGAQASDFNGDGLPDVLIANGHINDNRSTQELWRMPPQMLANVQGRRFQQVAAGVYFDEACLGRGVALLDFDRDFRMDAVVVHQDRSAALLKNHSQISQSLRVRLAGTRGNRDAVNAIIDVESDSGTVRQWSCGSHGFMATNERVFFFAKPEGEFRRISVQWPSGSVTSFEPSPSLSAVVIREDGRWFVDPN